MRAEWVWRDDSGEVSMQDVRALPGFSRRVTSCGLGWLEALQEHESGRIGMVCLTNVLLFRGGSHVLEIFLARA